MGVIIQDAMILCPLACEAEAVADGLPPELGREIYEGCVRDDLEEWTQEYFLAWARDLDRRYLVDGKTQRDLTNLYGKISKIISAYGDRLTRD